MSPRPRVAASADVGLRRARRWSAIWGLLLLALTSFPSPPEVPVVSNIPDFDKLIHAVLYGVEGFFLFRSVRWPGRARFSLTRVLAIAGLLAVWGTVDEVHQHWIPGRSMEGADAIVDTAAGAAGALAAAWLAARGARREPEVTRARVRRG